jgi:hypothetical protein
VKRRFVIELNDEFQWPDQTAGQMASFLGDRASREVRAMGFQIVVENFYGRPVNCFIREEGTDGSPDPSGVDVEDWRRVRLTRDRLTGEIQEQMSLRDEMMQQIRNLRRTLDAQREAVSVKNMISGEMRESRPAAEREEREPPQAVLSEGRKIKL